jgi:fluoroquinolone transport system ATP-binding protein
MKTSALIFEFPSLYEKLTARENLRFFASLYKRSLDADELLKSVVLLNDADKPRIGFLKRDEIPLEFHQGPDHNNPKLLFLDEPTSGLDPSNARQMKDIILKTEVNGNKPYCLPHTICTTPPSCATG